MKTTNVLSVRLFGIALTALMGFWLTSCDNGTTPTKTHTHDWGAWTVTRVATCTTAGEETRICTLDPTHKETREIAIDPTAHVWGEWEAETEPTCTETGSGSRKCKICNTTETLNVILALGHNYHYVTTTHATCTTDGAEAGTCTHDAAHTTTRPIAALGHDWDYWMQTTAPTCTTAGVETRTCNHDATHQETRAIAIDPNAHDWGNWIQTTAPTCTTVGVETGICTRDGTHTETQPVAALGHEWEWVETSTGIETKTCSHFGETDGIRLTLDIGDTGPGGGKIFFRSETGFVMTDTNETCHYLEASPVSLRNEKPGLGGTLPLGFPWASEDFVDYYIIGTADSIGSGRKNTALILNTDENAPAAKACIDYGVPNDWFLPSIDELNQLYLNRNIFDNFLIGAEEYLQWTCYWSSSQSSSFNDYAFFRQFTDYSGDGGSSHKSNFQKARAIRAF